MSSGIGKYDLHKREMLEMRGPFLTSIFITPEGRVQCWTVSIYNGIQGPSALSIICTKLCANTDYLGPPTRPTERPERHVRGVQEVPCVRQQKVELLTLTLQSLDYTF